MRALLLLDTCGAIGYVAVADADAPAGAVAERTLPARKTQEQLLPAMEAVLAAAGIGVAGLAGVVVVTGPGSFTGVRIGLAAAKGLVEATGVPLMACSRLAVLAAAGENSAGEEVTAWLDAGRTDIYAGVYRRGPDGGLVCVGERMLPRGVAIQEARTPPVIVEAALDGIVAGAQLLAEVHLQLALRGLAVELFHAAAFADTALLDANYLRVPDAEMTMRARQGI